MQFALGPHPRDLRCPQGRASLRSGAPRTGQGLTFHLLSWLGLLEPVSRQPLEQAQGEMLKSVWRAVAGRGRWRPAFGPPENFLAASRPVSFLVHSRHLPTRHAPSGLPRNGKSAPAHAHTATAHD